MANELIQHDMLAKRKQQPYFLNTLQTIVSERRSGVTIYPPQKDVFNTFRFTRLGNVKVMVLGQDPYHESGQAYDLAFPTHPGIATPPSLLNMYRELKNTIPGFTHPNHGYPESWARQGVSPLNITLTVRVDQAHFYASLGWGTFTDKVISLTNQHHEGMAFLLWGLHAQKKGVTIGKQRHHILKAPHPSPLSAHRGFLGCGHFVLASQWLEQRGETPTGQVPVLSAGNE